MGGERSVGGVPDSTSLPAYALSQISFNPLVRYLWELLWNVAAMFATIARSQIPPPAQRPYLRYSIPLLTFPTVNWRPR